MKKLAAAAILITSLFLSAAASFAEEIILSAGSGPLDSIINPVKDAFEKESGIKLNILFGSASLSFKQLYRKVSEAGVVGISFDGVMKLMEKENFEVRDKDKLKHFELGKAYVRTVVNAKNSVKVLTKDQLKAVFTGKITNWKDIGGSDAQIIVIVSNLNPATKEAFTKAILDGEPLLNERIEVGHMNELREAVELNEDSITFGTSLLLSQSTKQVETPEVSRSVTLITWGEPLPKVQKLIDFIKSDKGRSLVRE